MSLDSLTDAIRRLDEARDAGLPEALSKIARANGAASSNFAGSAGTADFYNARSLG